MRRFSPLITLLWLLMMATPAGATRGPISSAGVTANVLLAQDGGNQPALRVISPANGQDLGAPTVTVTFQVSNFQIVPSTVPLSEAGRHPELNRAGQGHLHLMLDLQPLVIWDQNRPYTFDNVPEGTHQLMVELANNDHSSLTPRVMQTIQFSTHGPTTLPVTGDPGSAFPAGVVFAASGVALLAAGLWQRRPSARRYHL